MGSPTAMLFAFLTLTSIASFSQSEGRHEGLLARLSYRSTFVAEADRSPQICFAVYSDGFYRLLRAAQRPNFLIPESPRTGPLVVQGTLPKDQLARLRAMLRELKSGSEGGDIVLAGSESFMAEMGREGRTEHYTWVDADHLHPFPDCVAGLVDWLQTFKAQGSTPLTWHGLSDIPLCPPVTAKSLQPAIAGRSRRPDQTSRVRD